MAHPPVFVPLASLEVAKSVLRDLKASGAGKVAVLKPGTTWQFQVGTLTLIFEIQESGPRRRG